MLLYLKNFLNEKGEFYENPNFLGFSVGKRNCPGKYVAIRTLYVFFATLILNYKIGLKNNNVNLEQSYYFILQLKKQIALKMEKR